MMTFIDFIFRKLRSPKKWSDKCLKSPVSDDPSTNNMVNVQKCSWNHHHSTFSIFIDHCQVNWLAKSLSSINAESWECILTHWLFLIKTIERYQFRCNYLRKKNISSIFYCIFEMHIKFQIFWNKKWPS